MQDAYQGLANQGRAIKRIDFSISFQALCILNTFSFVSNTCMLSSPMGAQCIPNTRPPFPPRQQLETKD
eukprot:1157640-Pelagomonas_calceolata.AAC.6